MTVRELITLLGDLPPDLMVVHSTGMMQDREEITGYAFPEPAQIAWTSNINMIHDGWVELI